MRRKSKRMEQKKEIARAMLRAGDSYRKISETLEIGVATVHAVSREAETNDLERIVKEIKRGYVARHLMLAEYMFDSLPGKLISNTSVKDVAIAGAILTDKALAFEKSVSSSGCTASDSK